MIPIIIGGLIWLAVVGGMVWLYVLPSLIAFRRRHPHRWIILIIDLLFATTVVGWIWALFWALRVSRPPAGSGPQASALDVLTDDVRALVLTTPVAASLSPDPRSAGIAAQDIERLAGLHAAGHLTAAEFAALKATVIQRV